MGEALQVVGAVLHHNGRVLACRRRLQKADGGKWEFPGGKLEPGETPKSALRRELAEELDLHNVSIGKIIARAVTNTGDRLIDLTCYWAESKSQPVGSTDHDELRWCSDDELSDLDWALADLPTVAAIQASSKDGLVE